MDSFIVGHQALNSKIGYHLILECPAREPVTISASPLMTRSKSKAIEPLAEAGTDLTRMSYITFLFRVLLKMPLNRCLYLNPFLLEREIPHKSGKRSKEGSYWHHHHRRRR